MGFSSDRTWKIARGAFRIATAAVLIGASAAALATNYSEGAVTTGSYNYPGGAGHDNNGTCVDTLCTSYSSSNDLSNDPSNPTNMGALTNGNNFISGTLTTYGSTFLPDGKTPVGPNGELTNQDMDYVTFTIPTDYELAKFIVGDGTSISTNPRDDRVFLGLASGSSVSVASYGPSANSAVGLLGWTLVPETDVGTDILPAIGAADPSNFPSVPGASTFTGPLGAGTYTLWLYDGDSAATYSFDAVVAGVPELGTWAMMVGGLGVLGGAIRRKRIKAALV